MGAGTESSQVDPDQLRLALEDQNPVVSKNAAILLARRGDPRGNAILEDLIRGQGSTTPLSTRAAAAEALARLPQPDSGASLRTLDRELNEADAVVRSELLRGLARHTSPAREPLFLEALESPRQAVRQAAVDAWRESKQEPVPRSVLHRINDDDPQVRIAVIELIGSRRDADSLDLVETALADRNRTVREFAAAALARSGTEQAKAILKQHAVDGPELDRAAAVRALGLAGQSKAVYQAAEDASWRVRHAAALSLAKFPHRKTAAVAGRLVADQSMEVQSATITALADWPDALAVPVLLEALEDGGFRTKLDALAQIESRLHTDLQEPISPSPDAWNEFATRVRQQWKADRGRETFAQLPLAETGPRASPLESPLGRQVGQELEALASSDPNAVRRAAMKLVDFGPAALPAIQRWIENRPRPLPEPLVSEVLPRISPVYAAIDGLGYDTVSQRQKAAGELRRLVEQQALSTWSGENLVRRLAFEDDPFVWQEILKTLELDHVALARDAALIGLGHPRVEVRRQSCELLARHPRPEQVGPLEPLLRDENPTVQLAAAEALGTSNNPDAAPALSRLLTHPSKSLRLTTSKALAHLGDERGRDELSRLAYDLDPEVRRLAVLAMGEVGSEVFVPTLIAKLDDRQGDVRRAALTSLQTLADDEAEALAKIADPARQTEAWKRWWADRNTGIAGAKQRAPR